MADRKKTPDILGSLLGDTSKPEYHNTGIPEYHNDSKPVRQSTSKPARQKKAQAQAPDTAPAEKVKATFYLDAKTVEALEDGWIQLRKLADNRGRISKSLIVELALDMALEELEKRGSESSLYKKAFLMVT